MERSEEEIRAEIKRLEDGETLAYLQSLLPPKMDLGAIGNTLEDGSLEELAELKRMLVLSARAYPDDQNILRIMIHCVEELDDEGFDSLLTDLPEDLRVRVMGWFEMNPDY